MTPKEKAEELFIKMWQPLPAGNLPIEQSKERYNQHNAAKKCAIIAAENEYHSLREQLFNLRSCGMIQSDTVYSVRLQNLIDEEAEVKSEISKL
tara:strand:- start:205 stop:486 length:282 start_codon:yes stop_codon:yes gene_type:complete